MHRALALKRGFTRRVSVGEQDRRHNVALGRRIRRGNHIVRSVLNGGDHLHGAVVVIHNRKFHGVDVLVVHHRRQALALGGLAFLRNVGVGLARVGLRERHAAEQRLGGRLLVHAGGGVAEGSLAVGQLRSSLFRSRGFARHGLYGKGELARSGRTPVQHLVDLHAARGTEVHLRGVIVCERVVGIVDHGGLQRARRLVQRHFNRHGARGGVVLHAARVARSLRHAECIGAHLGEGDAAERERNGLAHRAAGSGGRQPVNADARNAARAVGNGRKRGTRRLQREGERLVLKHGAPGHGLGTADGALAGKHGIVRVVGVHEGRRAVLAHRGHLGLDSGRILALRGNLNNRNLHGVLGVVVGHALNATIDLGQLVHVGVAHIVAVELDVVEAELGVVVRLGVGGALRVSGHGHVRLVDCQVLK